MSKVDNPETKEYIRLEGTSQFSADRAFEAVQYFEYEGKTLVYVQAWDRSKPYGIVPGYKASEPYRTKNGVSAIRVTPISSEKEQEKLRPILSQLLKGHISFW